MPHNHSNQSHPGMNADDLQAPPCSGACRSPQAPQAIGGDTGPFYVLGVALPFLKEEFS